MTFPEQRENRFNLHPAVIWLLKFGAVVVTVLVVAVFGARLARDGTQMGPLQ